MPILKGFKHNKETKLKISLSSKGKKKKPFTEEHIKNIKIGRKNQIGDKVGVWKGNDVSYYGLHQWVRRWLGKANKCEFKDETCKGRFEWANIDGKYNRDLNDFISLCKSHHTRYDYEKKIN